MHSIMRVDTSHGKQFPKREKNCDENENPNY